MYERVSRLLEGELSRVINEEEAYLADESDEFLSFSPRDPTGALDRTNTDKTASEQSAAPNAQPANEEEAAKKKRTIPGLTTIVYDESGKAWDSDEYEKKQRNPYRWFLENQEKIRKYKGPTREEVAVSAMVPLLSLARHLHCSHFRS